MALKIGKLKYWGAFGAGILWGGTVVFVAGVLWLRSSLVLEARCQGGLEETAKKIEERGKGMKAWTVKREVCALPRTADKCGMTIFKLCNPVYAAEMLNSPASRRVSAVIPCTFAVYEKPDGGTYLARWNPRLLGLLLGGEAGRVFNGSVVPDQKHILDGLVEK